METNNKGDIYMLALSTHQVT